jgi:alcohol dehydrogenase class IV
MVKARGKREIRNPKSETNPNDRNSNDQNVEEHERMNGTSIGTFDWLMPQKIVFGDGRLAEIGELAAGFGRQVCLVTGGQSLRAAGHLERIAEQLDKRELQWLHLTIDHEPTVEAVDELAAQAAEFHPHAIVAVGGGSVLDAGKAVAALLTNGGQAVDYLEGVGCGRVLAAPSLPVIAAPTTAGTGSEATKNAVIGDRARTFKKSMRGDGLMPTVALVDPELTHGCPAAVTAACGMDALTQLLEAFASRRAHPLSDALAMQGLDLAGSLTRLAETPGEGTDRRPLREEMSLAALLGGISCRRWCAQMPAAPGRKKGRRSWPCRSTPALWSF